MNRLRGYVAFVAVAAGGHMINERDARAQTPPASAAPAAAPSPPLPPAPPPGYAPPPPGYGAPAGYGPPIGYYPPPYYGYGYPPPPYPPEPPKERNSTALMVVGIVATSVGALGLAAGAAMFVAADTPSCQYDGDVMACERKDDARTAGIALMITGGIGLGLGIPFTVIGARKIPKKAPAAEAKLVVRPTSIGVNVTF